MFRRLVSNLPFNPSLIHQVGFYADRLKGETIIRRLSFVMMALVVALQAFAVISPPEKSLAADDSHMMNGLNSKADILAYYDNPNSNVRLIFEHYNISRADLANLTDTPNVSIFTNDGNDWWTVGMYSLNLRSDVQQQYKDNERTVEYAPGKFVYERQWRAFDIINRNGQWRTAWKGVNSATGQEFWIVQSCGNITWVGDWKQPTPEPEPDPEPTLEISKSIVKKPTMNPGDSFTYRISYRNSAVGSVAAKDVQITDQLDVRYVDLVSPSDVTISPTGFVSYTIPSLSYSDTWKVLELNVRIKNPVPNGVEICNDQASISASNAVKVRANPVCFPVIVPCPYDATVDNTNNPNCVKPVVRCELLDVALNLEKRQATFKTTASSSNDRLVTIKSYTYDFGDGTTQTVASSDFTNEITHDFASGTFAVSVVVTFEAPTEGGRTEQTVSCTQTVEFEEENPLGQQKTVKNITQNLTGNDALDSKVKNGDELQYILYTLNENNYERTNTTISDYVGDILDYATLDTVALEASGGRYDEQDKKVIWENVTIPANGKVERSFKVTMLNPIPATNRPSDQGSDYDCVITNVYGDTVSLEVACPAVKGLETIPNTGPGTSLLIVSGITLVTGYFFARSRLLAKELQLIRTDYATTGGM